MDLRIWFLRSAAMVAAIMLAPAAHSQDGPYDPDFGSVGRTWIDVTPSQFDTGYSLIRLPNGNFFMSGSCGSVSCAAWLTPAGALASGFGSSGAGTALFSAFAGWPNDETVGGRDAAALSDGRVVVISNKSGNSSGYAAVLLANGTGLDPAVGNGAGYISPNSAPLLVRVTAQQQIVTVSTTATGTAGIVVRRYDSTLHLDTSFGSGGSITIGFDDGNFPAYGMTLQRDGKIVVIGEVQSTQRSVGIIRLTADGAPDPAFGINSDGRYESTLGNQYSVGGRAIVEDKKGRLVFAGRAATASSGAGEWLVNRILSGGAIDTSFNAGQPQEFTIASSSTFDSPVACCVALQSDNKIVVAGEVNRTNDSFERYFGLARFWDNGTFDSSFGGGGQSYGDMSTQAPNVTTDEVRALVLVGGGIVVGTATTATSNETRFVAAKARIDLLLAADFE